MPQMEAGHVSAARKLGRRRRRERRKAYAGVKAETVEVNHLAECS